MRAHLYIAVIVAISISCGCKDWSLPPQPKAVSNASETKLNEKLDQGLQDMLQTLEQGGEDKVSVWAGEKMITLDQNRIQVKIVLDGAQNVAAAKERLTASGGEIIAAVDNVLYALVPIAAVKQVAAEESVWFMALSHRIMSPMDEKSLPAPELPNTTDGHAK